MTNEISAAVQKRVAAEVIKHIDIEAMAKRLAPKVAKEIEAAIIQSVSKIHWGDELSDILVSKKPVRIQRKRTKGWKMPEGAVYVGRPSRFGNPWSIEHRGGWWFVVGPNTPVGGIRCGNKEGAALAAVRFFRDMLTEPGRNYPTCEEIKAELRGKNLACFCPLDQPCHADVLLEIAN